MKAVYYQRGETLDYIPADDVESGAVVSLVTRVGVTAAPIRAGEQGAVHVVGVFTMTKADGEAIEQGDAVYYDASADAITTAEAPVAVQNDGDEKGDEESGVTPVENIPAGYAAASAAATDATVLVKLLG